MKVIERKTLGIFFLIFTIVLNMFPISVFADVNNQQIQKIRIGLDDKELDEKDIIKTDSTKIHDLELKFDQSMTNMSIEFEGLDTEKCIMLSEDKEKKETEKGFILENKEDRLLCDLIKGDEIKLKVKFVEGKNFKIHVLFEEDEIESREYEVKFTESQEIEVEKKNEDNKTSEEIVVEDTNVVNEQEDETEKEDNESSENIVVEDANVVEDTNTVNEQEDETEKEDNETSENIVVEDANVVNEQEDETEKEDNETSENIVVEATNVVEDTNVVNEQEDETDKGIIAERFRAADALNVPRELLTEEGLWETASAGVEYWKQREDGYKAVYTPEYWLLTPGSVVTEDAIKENNTLDVPVINYEDVPKKERNFLKQLRRLTVEEQFPHTVKVPGQTDIGDICWAGTAVVATRTQAIKENYLNYRTEFGKAGTTHYFKRLTTVKTFAPSLMFWKAVDVANWSSKVKEKVNGKANRTAFACQDQKKYSPNGKVPAFVYYLKQEGDYKIYKIRVNYPQDKKYVDKYFDNSDGSFAKSKQPLQGFFAVYAPKPKKANLKIKKTDMNGKALSGAQFEVKWGSSHWIDTNGNLTTKRTTVNCGINGNTIPIKMKNPSWDYMTINVTEVKAPDGYKLSSETITKKCFAGKTTEYTFKNERKPAYLKIKKTDMNGKALSGAQFEVKWQNYWIDTNGNLTTKRTTVSCGINGNTIPIKMKDQSWNYMTISVKEVKAPDGYKLSSETITKKCFVGNTTEYTFKNERKPAHLKIKKTDVNGKALSGAQFEVKWQNYWIDTNGNLTTKRTTVNCGINGNTIPIKMKDQSWDYMTISVKEVKAPDGYKLSSETITKKCFANKTTEYTFKNEPIPHAPLEVEKAYQNPNVGKDNNCYSLEGAMYYTYRSTSKKQAIEYAKRGKIGDYTSGYVSGGWIRTNKNGYGKTEKNFPAIDDNGNQYYYAVKEVKASKGCNLDPNIYVRTIPTSGAAIQKIKTIKSVEPMKLDPGKITLKKTWKRDEYDPNVDGDLEKWLENMTKNGLTPTIPSLEGAQFAIKYYDNDAATSLADIKGKTPKRIWVIETKKIINSYGTQYRAKFDDKCLVKDHELYNTGISHEFYRGKLGEPLFPIGCITIEEVKAPTGYELKGDFADNSGNKYDATKPKFVRIKANGEEADVEFGNMRTGYNLPKKGSIKLIKYGPNGEKLEGAEYQIKSKTTGKVVGTKITGKNGEVLFDNLYPDVYIVTETRSAPGSNTTMLKKPFEVSIPQKWTQEEIDQFKKEGINIDMSKFTKDERDGNFYNLDVTYSVTNDSQFVVPMTGGKENYWPIFLGTSILAFGLFMFWKKEEVR